MEQTCVSRYAPANIIHEYQPWLCVSIVIVRIVVSTWGTFGDLHPVLALCAGLRQRGHHLSIATCPLYRERVEALGYEFHPLRPDLPDPKEIHDLARRVMDPRTGTKTMLTDVLLPSLRDMDDDLHAACKNADLLISHSLVFPSPIVAERLGIPFYSMVLQPIVFCSAYDPPIPPGVTKMIGKPMPPPGVMAPLLKLAKYQTRRWVKAVDRLRSEYHLQKGGHPLFDGQFSPDLTLALFSPQLGAPQPDWPANVVQPGFLFHDHLEGGEAAGWSADVQEFLDAGPAPILFTLGTSAVFAAGDFFKQSAWAAHRAGHRSVLLVGRLPDGQTELEGLPPGALAVPYAPHSMIMPKCSLVVHQGGAGTTAQAMRAGKPQLVVPFAHDQPDNAHRIVKAGLGAWRPRRRCKGMGYTRLLRSLMSDDVIKATAQLTGELVAAENGVGGACDAIEKTWARHQAKTKK